MTGGKQMDGFVSLVQERIESAGVPANAISSGSRLELPGWYRAEKEWDLIITLRGELVAAIELKSHVGPSFGNNFNNRTEEAMGSATDLWAAYREGAFKPSARPWLGYMMLLEDCERSRRPVKVSEPHFPVFPEFQGASYQERYRQFVRKLLRDRLYDGACLIVSPAQSIATGDYVEPDPELTIERFMASMLGTLHAALARIG